MEYVIGTLSHKNCKLQPLGLKGGSLRAFFFWDTSLSSPQQTHNEKPKQTPKTQAKMPRAHARPRRRV